MPEHYLTVAVVPPSCQSNDLALSDPDMGGTVDILLGQEYPWDFCGKVQKIDHHCFIQTNFGIGVIGLIHRRVNVLTVTSATTPLAQDLSRLWELDQVPEASRFSRVDQSVVDRFHVPLIACHHKVIQLSVE